MLSDYTQQDSQQKTLDAFKASTRQRKRRSSEKQSILKCRLNEVITGKCPALKLFSKTLQSDVWFVNEGLVDLEKEVFPGRVITMAMLAEMLCAKNSHYLNHREH
jgi:hypothetical protein